MTTKLFGQETPEQREARIKMPEEQIKEAENNSLSLRIWKAGKMLGCLTWLDLQALW